MATVAQVAKASLQKILVQGSEAPFEADEYQDFIFALNAYMTDLAANGISLGYTVVYSLSDEVTVPTGALRGVIYNMALEVAPDYGGIVSAECQRIAAQSLDTMRMIGQTIPESSYPSTLPCGSGNACQSAYFYPDMEAEILGESTGSIGLESETEI